MQPAFVEMEQDKVSVMQSLQPKLKIIEQVVIAR